MSSAPRRPGPVWNRSRTTSRTTSRVSCPGCGKSSRHRLLRLMATRTCDRPVDIFFNQSKFQSSLTSFNGRCAIMNECIWRWDGAVNSRTREHRSVFHYSNTSRSYGEMCDVDRYPSGCFGMIFFSSSCISPIVSTLFKFQSQCLFQYHTVLVSIIRSATSTELIVRSSLLNKKRCYSYFHLSILGIQNRVSYSQQGASTMY